MALTVEHTSIDAAAVADRLHGDACHINVVHEFSLGFLVEFVTDGTVGNKLLGSRDEVVAILVLDREYVCYFRIGHGCSLQSLFRAVATFVVCVKHFGGNGVESLHFIITEYHLSSLIPFAEFILLNQRKVTALNVVKAISDVE